MWLIVVVLVFLVACNVAQEDLVPEVESENILNDATLDSLMFSLDGVIYTLPVHFSELEANGWTPYDTNPRSGGGYRFTTDTLEPGDFVCWELIFDSQNVVVSFTNFSEEVLPVSKGDITFVGVIYDVYNAQLILPGNIMIGSTYEDVIAAYGEPDGGPHIVNDIMTIFYDLDYFNLQISVNIETNSVIIISLDYWGEVWTQSAIDPMPLLPNTSENTSSNLMLETVRQFCARFFSPVE